MSSDIAKAILAHKAKLLAKSAEVQERPVPEQLIAPAPAVASKKKPAGGEPDGSLPRKSQRLTSSASGSGNAVTASPQVNGVPESPSVSVVSPSADSAKAAFAHGSVSNYIFDPEGPHGSIFWRSSE